MKRAILLGIVAVVAASLDAADIGCPAVLRTVNDRLAREFISHDGLLLDYVGDIPTPEEIAELKPNAMGWWSPIENGSMFTGEWLPALMAEGVGRKELIERCVRGLIKMSEVSDVPGFIARGTGTDGKSHHPCGSNDQTDPWFLGLCEYCRWPYADAALKEKALGRLVFVAKALEANAWGVPCDGPFKGQNRGNLNAKKMPFWGKTRLMYSLKLLQALTGDVHWGKAYDGIKAGALDEIEAGGEVDAKVFKPCYGHGVWIYLSSAQALKRLIEMEENPVDRARMKKGFLHYAERVAPLMKDRAKYANTTERPFKYANWRTGYRWRVQKTQKEAESVAYMGKPEILGTRKDYERNGMANPLAAAAICALQGDDKFHDEIRATLKHYDYSTPNVSEFFHAAIAAAALGEKVSCEQRAAFESYRRAWAAERPRIEADIDANRKAQLTIRVVDAEGHSVSGVVVRVEQLTHDFRFGCSILALGQLGRDNAAYEDAFAKLFNHATTTFCLGAIEPVKGEVRFAEGSREIWRRPPPDRVLAFCKPRGIACKGQPLLAGSWHPQWAKSMDEKETKKLYADYFRRVAERYGESYQMFDVVNEAYCHTDFRLYEPETHYVDWAFAEAARYFPASCQLTVNEATPVNWWTFSPSRWSPQPNICGSRYHRMISRMLGQGIRLDGIGFQLHFFGVRGLKDAICGGGNDIRDWRENYGRFEEFGKPLFITEITVPTVLPEGWTGDGEEVQAEVLSNLYRFYFSLPAFAGITYWNLYDGATYKRTGWDESVTNAGLLDYAAREKPAYQALYQLINREWKTFARLCTGSDGTVSLRGFRGAYRIDVRQGDAQVESEVRLLADGATVELRLS